MLISFLQNKMYSFIIAKVAVVFQSVITLAVSLFLIFFLSGVLLPLPLLVAALLLDVLFVIVHLSYRVLYNGEKVKLEQFETRVLIVHSGASLLALGMTFFSIKNSLNGSAVYILSTLFVWGTSLISGIVFFVKKYYSTG